MLTRKLRQIALWTTISLASLVSAACDECENPEDEFGLGNRHTIRYTDSYPDFYAKTTLEGPYQCTRGPNCYRVICETDDYYDGNTDLSIIANYLDGTSDILAIPAANRMKRHISASNLTHHELSQIQSFECNVGIKRENGTSQIYEHTALEKEIVQVDIVGMLCNDAWLNAPDAEYRANSDNY